MKKQLLTSVALLTGPVALFAQTAARNTNVDYVANPVITPQFFIAVIAGVLLALGFQFILTALSVAAGITAVGDLKERYVENKYDTKSKDTFMDDDGDKGDDDDGMSTGKMVTTGFGIWSVVTACISLFGATALAINLSLISSTVISITLGLVIWATFFILLFYLESRLVNTLIGGLINTATAGLRASGQAVKEVATSAFSTSKETQMKHVAEDTVDKIRKDLRSSFDPSVINETIDDFFKRFDNNVPNYDKVKRDIQEIVEQSNKQQGRIEKENIKEKQDQQSSGGGGQGKWLAISQVISNAIQNSDGDKGSPEDKDKVEQLKKLQKELKSAYDEGGTNEEKLEKVAAKLTPADEEQIHSYVEKIKGMLSKASPDDMEKEEFKDQIMQVVQDPKAQANKLAASVGKIDRETIVSALAENTALTRDQIEKYADKIEEILKEIKDKYESITGGEGSGDLSDIKKKAEQAISRFMGSSNGSVDLDTGMLTSLFQSKLDDGKESLSVVKRKIQNMDQDSVKAMVLNNTALEQSHIDKVVQSIEEAKTGVMNKITEVETAANRKIENMKRKAVIEAEHARQNAATAAWWVVASAVLSAGAAIVGSLVALG